MYARNFDVDGRFKTHRVGNASYTPLPTAAVIH